ncbi:MAG: epoxide hydrolase family protein, partial [Pseudomonadota bacterium]
LAALSAPIPSTAQEAVMVERFVIDIPREALDDLETRLAQTRLPDAIEGAGWDYGTNPDALVDLIRYWQSDYDWRAEEARLNAFDHFTAEIDGTTLHFVHARSSRDDAVPLLMLHGWPSSFVQMLDIAPRLTEPESGPAFHLVIPSLPGYGFSEIPSKRGMGPAAMAPLMHRLMTDALGYGRYGIRSSDLGAGVASSMVSSFPDAIIGSHTGGTNPYLQQPLPDDLSEEERVFVQNAQMWIFTEMAYASLHSSKPQTIAFALNDSPAGLASWFLEKFERWVDHDGDLYTVIARDTLLTNLTIYWVTGTINSSMRLYYEAARAEGYRGVPRVPVGYLMPVNDFFPTPRSWSERQGPVAHWTTSEVGGHFLEWEQPDIVADDLRRFFSGL